MSWWSGWRTTTFVVIKSKTERLIHSGIETVRFQYLADLGCRLVLGEAPLKQIIDWLLDHAIALLYSETREAQALTSKALLEMREERARRQQASDPISTLDFESNAAKEGIESLRSLLGIAAYPDPKVVLKASCKVSFVVLFFCGCILPMKNYSLAFIVSNLSDDAIGKSNISNKAGAPQPMVMQLSRFDVGMLSSKDGGVDAAVRALRLNHLEDLREVQTQINEAIVAVQELTADPKTDKRLGKVGF
ncbi:unnamed protein product [Toxocara canis]|uniref:COMM domain-containing protein n=1 Tax=Toxocara canis TaxID=6265 RepID=A0A183UBB2_TOXCA|nr:unnamed protein product [Toxocara canis]